MHSIASGDKHYADERELKNMVSELLNTVQYRESKQNRQKGSELCHINEDTLKAIHKTMDKRKAYELINDKRRL